VRADIAVDVLWLQEQQLILLHAEIALTFSASFSAIHAHDTALKWAKEALVRTTIFSLPRKFLTCRRASCHRF
jgi:hypothetical protein